MPDYITKDTLNQPNNEAEKRKKQDSVVAVPAKEKKKSLWQEIKEEFVVEDRRTVSEYLVKDVFVPLAKGMIQAIANNAVDMFLYGGGSGVHNRNSYTPYKSNNVSYRPYYDQKPANNNGYYSKPRTAYGYDYTEIVFESRADAEAVFYRMMEILGTYSVVRVADYLEISGRDSSYTDNNYGWTNMDNVQIRRSRDGGFFLDLPKPLPID